MNTILLKLGDSAAQSATLSSSRDPLLATRALGVAAIAPAQRDYRGEIRALLSRVTPEQLERVKNRRKTVEEARAFFWSHVQIGEPDQCWLWEGSTTPVGNRNGDVYGLTSINGEPGLAHRWAYRLTKGEIPEGLVVRHTCDTFLCCNPRHLITGTPQQNMDDAVERGRIPRGMIVVRGAIPKADRVVRRAVCPASKPSMFSSSAGCITGAGRAHHSLHGYSESVNRR